LEITPIDGDGTWSGSISLRNPASPVSGDGVFVTLTFDVADTTDCVTIDGTAIFAGFEGSCFENCLQRTVIVIDNEINQKNGGANVGGKLNKEVFDGKKINVVAVANVEVTLVNLMTGGRLTVTTDSEGNYLFTDLRAGNYALASEDGIYITGCREFKITDADVTGKVTIDIDPMEMVIGDLNADGRINIADFTLLAGSYGLSSGDLGFNALADLNNDATINVLDLSILGSHFNIENSCTKIAP